MRTRTEKDAGGDQRQRKLRDVLYQVVAVCTSQYVGLRKFHPRVLNQHNTQQRKKKKNKKMGRKQGEKEAKKQAIQNEKKDLSSRARRGERPNAQDINRGEEMLCSREVK